MRCDASPNGPFRGDESRGYADNLFRVNRRIHDIADAMAGRGHQWPEESGSHRDHATTAEVIAKAFGDWYERRHGREPSGEAVRWLAGDWVTGTLPGYEHAVSPHRVRALLAYMDDDWLPEEPATAAAYKLLPEWGVGDSFAGGLAYGYLACRDYVVACQYGNAMGAQRCTGTDLNVYLSREETERQILAAYGPQPAVGEVS